MGSFLRRSENEMDMYVFLLYRHFPGGNPLSSTMVTHANQGFVWKDMERKRGQQIWLIGIIYERTIGTPDGAMMASIPGTHQIKMSNAVGPQDFRHQ